MLKKKWTVVVLVLGLLATGAYNFAFFVKREQKRSPPREEGHETIDPADPEPSPVLNQIEQEDEGTDGQSVVLVAPRLSMDEIYEQANRPLDFTLNGQPVRGGRWAARDIFQDSRPALSKFNQPEKLDSPLKHIEKRAPTRAREPAMTLSGILVQGKLRYALINGDAMGVGALFDQWKIVAIEPEFVLLEGPGGIRRKKLLRPAGKDS